ncbi:MAG: hypothetical protein HRU11_04155 [Parvularculaceae bacterium]|nr:hypothetical protein [Parvularculaceae bacterium]
MKRPFTVIGNCQAPVIAQNLLACPAFAAHHELIPFPGVHLLHPLDRETLAAEIAKADLVLFQTVVDRGLYAPFDSESLATLCAHAELVRIPNVYFDGYTPQVFAIGGLQGPIAELHDAGLLFGFLRDWSWEEALDRTFAPDALSADYCRARWDTSLRLLAEREEQYDVVGPVAGFIAEHGRRELLMHHYNHPSAAVMEQIQQSLLAHLGFGGEDRAAAKGVAGTSFAPHPSVQVALSLDFVEPAGFLVPHNKPLATEDYVRRAFEVFAAADREQLTKAMERPIPRDISDELSDGDGGTSLISGLKGCWAGRSS